MQRTTGALRTELGRFLQTRRARLRPEDVGLDGDGKHRRVAGLRREEVAQLARVSVNYYTRLEQGQNRSASPEVLDALATALRLSPDERAHLHDLAGTAGPASRVVTPAESARPAVARMVAAYRQGPAIILGRQMNILAWNELARALFTGHIDFKGPDGRDVLPNLAELVFLEPGARELYPVWMDEAHELAGFLRVMVGRYPNDPGLSALIHKLSAGSPEFAEMWSGHVVWDKTHGTRYLHHPAVGRLTLTFETLRLPDAPDQCVILYQAESGSASEEALRSLLGNGETN
ncbi:helix-turn-helix transcriptional regulator [Streptomyces sp. A3M-1-3]|uniref:helix-turn-helix transcriptional regulator n=1 Tax=Streptomyces sp. A3M-1-3 TaxID=2962044 RepID=UPI0020B6C7A3|nr:helix-turn-helix transcriptional regulator [Streptomyces sp. A3M-1-3]MCP3821651.1 helix-turn-helix transcriptional regulator [Streptomyces sp. A3M-1-3]